MPTKLDTTNIPPMVKDGPDCQYLRDRIRVLEHENKCLRHAQTSWETDRRYFLGRMEDFRALEQRYLDLQFNEAKLATELKTLTPQYQKVKNELEFRTAQRDMANNQNKQLEAQNLEISAEYSDLEQKSNAWEAQANYYYNELKKQAAEVTKLGERVAYLEHLYQNNQDEQP